MLFDVFKSPFNADSLDSWAKNLDDIAKVSLLAVPVVLFGDYVAAIKAVIIALLFTCSYIMVALADKIRKNKSQLTEKK